MQADDKGAMSEDRTCETTSRDRPLAGAAAWVISDGKAGHEAQCLGVAEALGVSVAIKRVSPRGIWKTLSPWAPVAPAERFGASGSLFSPPWPTLAIAAGRLTTPYIRRLKGSAGFRTYTVVLMDPKTGDTTADLIWVPAHDKRRGPNIVTTLAAPHRFSPVRLAELRASLPPDIAAMPQPRVAVFLGGPNGDYRFSSDVLERLATALRAVATLGGSFMITPSRRTPPELMVAVETALAGAPCRFWDGDGENPYPAFLAHGDAFVVTADSVNMTGEACATGKPVYVFMAPGGSPKFDRFHAALRRHGATRPLPDRLSGFAHWTYEPLNSALVIAEEIERRWIAKSERLNKLPAGFGGGSA